MMGTLIKMVAVYHLIGSNQIFVEVLSQFLCALVIIHAAIVFLVFQQIYVETLAIKSFVI